MQSTKTGAPNTQYMRQPSATGGFLPGYGDNPFKLGAPATVAGPKSTYEPSPICAAAGAPAYVSGVINLILHLACAICTSVAAAMYLPPPEEKAPGNLDYTVYHDVDFVRSWVVVMITCEWLCVLLTVLYYGCVFKAMSLPIVGHLGLGLQLCATVSAIKLSYWIAIEPDAAKSMRDANGDGPIVATMYLGLLVIAGYIMTPISGNYYKIVANNLEGAKPEAWAP